ncbi:MAG: Ig-like domain repeat protein [Clostridiales bacterium]|nr:Ig-like domain repeat protein [Clostridiales bacterium]MDU3243044.1 Ig-like domain repeat protein [Clostridiales bacterium]
MKGFHKNKRWIAIVLMFVIVCTRVFGQIDAVYAAAPGNSAEAENQVKSKTEAEPAVETEAGAKTEDKTENGSGTEAENGTDTEAETENGAETESEAETEDGTETGSEAETEDGTETESEAETEDGTETESETEEKGFQISGKVIDIGSNAVSRAKVHLKMKPKVEEEEETNDTQRNDESVEGENVYLTNEEGEFTFTAELKEDMNYSVSISKENFVTETVEIDPDHADEDNIIQLETITIEKAVKIEGMISAFSSGRIKGESGVSVSILEHSVSDDEEIVLNKTETDEHGKYSITVKYRQQGYIVRIQKEGYEEHRIPIQGTEGVIKIPEYTLVKKTLNLSSEPMGAGSIVWKVFNEESNEYEDGHSVGYGGSARAYFKPNDKRYLEDCEVKPLNDVDSLVGEEVDSFVFEEDESGIAYIEIRNIKQDYKALADFRSKEKTVALKFDLEGKLEKNYEKNKYALEGTRIIIQDKKVKFYLKKGYYVLKSKLEHNLEGAPPVKEEIGNEGEEKERTFSISIPDMPSGQKYQLKVWVDENDTTPPEFEKIEGWSEGWKKESYNLNIYASDTKSKELLVWYEYIAENGKTEENYAKKSVDSERKEIFVITIPEEKKSYNGNYIIYVQDEAGNVAKRIVDVKIDMDEPIIEMKKNPAPGWTNEEVRFELTAEDKLSGIDKVYYKKISENGVAVTDEPVSMEAQIDENGNTYYAYTTEEEGITAYQFYAMDQAGNCSDILSRQVKLDKTKPHIEPVTSSAEYLDGTGRIWDKKRITLEAEAWDVVPDTDIGQIEPSDIEAVYISRTDPEDENFDLTGEDVREMTRVHGESRKYSYTIEPENASFLDRSYFIWAVDHAGNWTEVEEKRVSMDVGTPLIKSLIVLNDLSGLYDFEQLRSEWYGNRTVSIRVEAEDDPKGSGVQLIQLFVPGQTPGSFMELTQPKAAQKLAGKDSWYADFILPEHVLDSYGVSFPFKNKIYAMAIDYTEHKSEKSMAKEIMLENIAPKIDISLTEKPQCTVEVTGKKYDCYNRDTSLAVGVTDDLDQETGINSGIRSMQIKLNGKIIYNKLYAPKTLTPDMLEVKTEDAPIAEDGSYTVEVNVSDWSGNESEKKFTLYKDIHNPKIGKLSKTPASSWSPGKVTVQASDVCDSNLPFSSQIREVRYSTKNDFNSSRPASKDPNQKDTYYFEVKEESENSYYLWAIDHAANVSQVRSIKVSIDKTPPRLLKFEFQPENYQESNGEDLKGAATTTDYGYYFKEAATVTVFATDLFHNKNGANNPTSGLKYISYYIADEFGKQIIQGKKKTDEAGKIQIDIPPNFKGRIFAKPIDTVENMPGNHAEKSGIDTGYLQADAVIVEDENKHLETSDISMELPDTNKEDRENRPLYKNDTSVEVMVRDTYSGIRSIEWSVEAPYDSENNHTGTLEINNQSDITGEGAGWTVEKKEQNLVTEMKASIPISHNSNGIVVTIKLTDRAGNISSKKIDLSIDKTAPAINVDYDNASYDMDFADEREFYKEARTATITITERNFSQENVILTITNKYGGIPELHDWTEHQDQKDPDLTTYTATLTYQEDGDYQFGITCSDLAENESDYDEEDTFVIDMTQPEIQVAYDNNEVQNKYYYKDKRTATVTIKEKNFETSRVEIIGEASDNGEKKDFPVVSSWTSQGEDVYQATISYEEDAHYTFSAKYTDKAGNPEKQELKDDFYIDKTAPVLEFNEIEDKSANNGKVAPVVIWSDTNYGSQAEIRLKGSNRGKAELIGNYKESENGSSFLFDDFEYIQDWDDIYTLSASITDLAGNETSKEIIFSVNRFGSVYVMEKEARNIGGTYIQKEQDIMLTETNVDSLQEESVRVKVSHNGNTQDLKRGSDYTIDREGGDGSWTRYRYKIPAEKFREEGQYIVTVSSRDTAGNINENIDETKKAELRFGVDKTKPVVIPLNIDSDITYSEDSKVARIDISDNMVLKNVLIQLNGETVETVQDGQGAYLIPLKNQGNSQAISITAVDAAGNIGNVAVKNFYITTNLFIRWYTNRKLVTGTLIAAILILTGGTAGFLLMGSRKRKKRRTEG